MNAALPFHAHTAAVPLAASGTLREALQRRAAVGQRLGLEAAVAQIVPLCLETADIHLAGYGYYLHPSSISETPDGRLVLARERATFYPTDPRDAACLPPETQPGQLNDARGNVYAIAAIFYELLTGVSVGPGMRRPAELVPSLPATLDGVLSVALIAEVERRPDDLRALAQSIQQLVSVARPAPFAPAPMAPAPASLATMTPVPMTPVPMTPVPMNPVPMNPVPMNPLAMTLQGMPAPLAARNGAGRNAAAISTAALNSSPIPSINEPSIPMPSIPMPSIPSHPRGTPSLSVDLTLSSMPPGQGQHVPVIHNPLIPVIQNGAHGVPPSAMGVPPSSSLGVSPSSAPPSSVQPSSVQPSSVPPSAALNGYGVVAVQAQPDRSAAQQAARFAELKSQLEADQRPRYFVVKNGMDHGPFTAVELVRQIDAHAFTEDDHVVDSIDGRRAPLLEWPQFALFAEHAKRERQLAQRQKDIVKVAAAEKKSTRGKTLAGVLLVVSVLGAIGVWYSTTTGTRRDGVVIQEDESTNVETDGALAIKGKKKARRRSSSSAAGIPQIAGGQSCEAAMDAYNEEKSMNGEGQADITAGQYGRVLNSGSYFSHCGVPMSMSVSICAAVQNGKAVGVTVSTQPGDAKRAACVASAVRALSFPSHPKLDVTRTRFDAQ